MSNADCLLPQIVAFHATAIEMPLRAPCCLFSPLGQANSINMQNSCSALSSPGRGAGADATAALWARLC